MPAPWRRPKQRDENEKKIVDELRSLGFLVWRLDEPADLAVLCMGRSWHMVEVKNPTTHSRRAGGDLRSFRQSLMPAHISICIIEIESTDDFLRSHRRSCRCSKDPAASSPS